jgi:hypothetical protein
MRDIDLKKDIYPYEGWPNQKYNEEFATSLVQFKNKVNSWAKWVVYGGRTLSDTIWIQTNCQYKVEFWAGWIIFENMEDVLLYRFYKVRAIFKRAPVTKI